MISCRYIRNSARPRFDSPSDTAFVSKAMPQATALLSQTNDVSPQSESLHDCMDCFPQNRGTRRLGSLRRRTRQKLPGNLRLRLCVQHRQRLWAQCCICDPTAGPTVRNRFCRSIRRPGQDGLPKRLVRTAGRYRSGPTRPHTVSPVGYLSRRCPHRFSKGGQYRTDCIRSGTDDWGKYCLIVVWQLYANKDGHGYLVGDRQNQMQSIQRYRDLPPPLPTNPE